MIEIKDTDGKVIDVYLEEGVIGAEEKLAKYEAAYQEGVNEA